MITRELLERMKPTAWFVNTARAKLVDNVALAEMLAAGRIAGAALDVHDEEPVRGDHAFRNLPNVLITPHIGYNTREASANMLRISIDTVVGLRARRAPPRRQRPVRPRSARRTRGSILLEVRAVRSQARQDRVQVVRRAAEQATRVIGPGLEHDATADERLGRAWLDEGETHRLPCTRRRIGEPVAVFGRALQVVQLGERRGHAAEDGMAGDVPHALALEPRLAGAAKSLQIFSAGPSWHLSSSLLRRKVGATLAPDHTRSPSLMKQVHLDSVPSVAAHSKAEVP